MSETKPRINAIPKDSVLHNHVPEFGPKDVARYRLYNSYNPHTKKYNLRDVCIPSQDIVTDPDTGISYEIGFVKNETPKGPQFGEIWFETSGLCSFVLHGNRVNDRKIFDYIERSNFNANNPHRDPSAPILIERIKEDTDSSKLREIRKGRLRAFDFIDSMSEKDVISYLKKNNYPVAGTDSQRRNFLEELVEKGEFNQILNASLGDGGDKITSLIDMIADLKKKEKIAYDKTNKIWTANDTTFLFKGKGGVGVKPEVEFAKCLASPDGAAALAKLEELKA